MERDIFSIYNFGDTDVSALDLGDGSVPLSELVDVDSAYDSGQLAIYSALADLGHQGFFDKYGVSAGEAVSYQDFQRSEAAGDTDAAYSFLQEANNRGSNFNAGLDSSMGSGEILKDNLAGVLDFISGPGDSDISTGVQGTSYQGVPVADFSGITDVLREKYGGNEFVSAGEALSNQYPGGMLSPEFVSDVRSGIEDSFDKFREEPIMYPLRSIGSALYETGKSAYNFFDKSLAERVESMYGIGLHDATANQINTARQGVLGDAVTAGSVIGGPAGFAAKKAVGKGFSVIDAAQKEQARKFYTDLYPDEAFLISQLSDEELLSMGSGKTNPLNTGASLDDVPMIGATGSVMRTDVTDDSSLSEALSLREGGSSAAEILTKTGLRFYPDRDAAGNLRGEFAATIIPPSAIKMSPVFDLVAAGAKNDSAALKNARGLPEPEIEFVDKDPNLRRGGVAVDMVTNKKAFYLDDIVNGISSIKSQTLADNPDLVRLEDYKVVFGDHPDKSTGGFHDSNRKLIFVNMKSPLAKSVNGMENIIRHELEHAVSDIAFEYKSTGPSISGGNPSRLIEYKKERVPTLRKIIAQEVGPTARKLDAQEELDALMNTTSMQGYMGGIGEMSARATEFGGKGPEQYVHLRGRDVLNPYINPTLEGRSGVTRAGPLIDASGILSENNVLSMERGIGSLIPSSVSEKLGARLGILRALSPEIMQQFNVNKPILRNVVRRPTSYEESFDMGSPVEVRQIAERQKRFEDAMSRDEIPFKRGGIVNGLYN